MLREERRKLILEILKKDKVVKAVDLSIHFQVGIETIRRDFDSLEKSGLLKKIYGGATIEESKIESIEYSKRAKLDISEKNEIAQKAVNFIREGDSISLNDSSTNLLLAKEVKKQVKNLTVITNSLLIASELSDMDNYTVVLAGGFLDNKEKAFFGTMTEKVISEFIVDKSFVSVGSVSLKNDLTDFPLKEVAIQQMLMKYSKEIIILANSQKFETTALIKVGELKNVKRIITDSNLDNQIYEEYLKNGIEIIK